MTTMGFQDRPPQSDRLTAYDESHLAAYIRLLDADAEGADWREAVQIIVGFEPDQDPGRARTMHESHLARARRMTTT
ncbi:MAG: DUF2285 domain-containing protein, partial [Alphaproteobacteria bacterium]